MKGGGGEGREGSEEGRKRGREGGKEGGRERGREGGWERREGRKGKGEGMRNIMEREVVGEQKPYFSWSKCLWLQCQL